MPRTLNHARLGQAVLAHRLRTGTTLREAASASGVNNEVISRVERGLSARLAADTAVALCDWMGRHLGDFMDDVGEAEPVAA